MEGELAPLVLDGVAGVVAALVADHHVGLLAEQVDDLAFAFVAPLGADHDENRHVCLPIDHCSENARTHRARRATRRQFTPALNV